MVGCRPYTHCGSPKHWNYECKHAKQGARRVRPNFVNLLQDYLESQEANDKLYYASEDEENSQMENQPNKESGIL